MPFEDARLRLTDILQAISSIGQFVSGMDLNHYATDERTQAAVERKLLVISEAANRLQIRRKPCVPKSRGETFVA